MVRQIAFLCAAVAGFGLTLERPNNLAEARRRCCCNQYQYSGNYCQTGYQSYAYQNQYVNQCGQTYGQGTQYQSYTQGGEAIAPQPAPAPAPENRSSYYRNGNAPQEIRRNGTTVPPAPATAPAPTTGGTAPATGQQRTFDDAGTNRTSIPERNAPATERPAAPAPTVPE